MRTIQVTLILLLVLFLACEKEKTTTPTETGYLVETPETDKLNAYPILGYMETEGDLAPEIDGSASDYIWQDIYSPPYEIETQAGKDGFAPTVTMKALYDNWYLYLLITWEDETESFQKNTWWFGEPDAQEYTIVNVYDTTFTYYRTEDTVSTNRRVEELVQKEWTMINNLFQGIIKTITYKVDVIIDSTQTSPTPQYIDGGTSTKYDTTIISGDEDGYAIMWNYSSSNFISCSNLCHSASSMATNIEDSVDVWRWNAHKTNFIGYVDDKYLAENGFHGDVGDSCSVINRSGSLPMYMHSENSADVSFNANFLYDSIGVSILSFYEDIEWEAGNTIPGYVLQKPTESRNDIRARGNYEDGKWKIEIKRRLITPEYLGSPDVEFNPDTDANIDFHIAVFDNSQGQDHAISTTVHILHFLQLNK